MSAVAISVASFFAEVVVVAIATATASSAASPEAATASASAASASAAAAVTTATATRTTTAASGTTAAATTWLSLLGNVHADSATIEALTIHLLHGGLGRIPFGERHEAKASGAPRLTVGDHLGFNDFSKRRESIA